MMRWGFLKQVLRSDQVISSLSRCRHHAWRSCLVIALAGLGCHDGSTTPVEVPVTFSLEKAPTNSGDLQSDSVLATIQPLRVLVRADSDAAPGVQVFWLVSADARTDSSTSITDATGVASLALTFGPKPLVYTVEASLRKTVSGPSVTFTVTAIPGRAAAIRITSGANQSDTATAPLSTAYAVQATDAYGNSIAGVEINWAVTTGGGSISPPRSITAADGQATARHTLGPTTGVNEVTASAFAVGTPVTFRATATAARPAKLKMISGNSQSGEVNRPLTADYVVRVTDSYDNAIAGMVIDWAITRGDGSLSSMQSVTGADGSAASKLTLGATAGPHEVTATAAVLPGAPRVAFTSTAVAPPPPPPPPPPKPPLPQSASLRITISTTGVDFDNAILVHAQPCPQYPNNCASGPSQTATANSTIMFGLGAGDYGISLSQVALNCSVAQNSKKVTLSLGVTTDVAFSVTCVPATRIRVSATTSGTDVATSYPVAVDGIFAGDVGGLGSFTTVVAAGSRTITLQNVPANCVVNGANPVTVTATEGVTTNVAFTVTCAPNPTLRVTVTTTGVGIPPSFFVGVDLDYYYYYYTYTFTQPANGVASIRLPVGNHQVYLDGLPFNCSITSATWASVQMPLGATVDVAFAVTCR